MSKQKKHVHIFKEEVNKNLINQKAATWNVLSSNQVGRFSTRFLDLDLFGKKFDFKNGILKVNR